MNILWRLAVNRPQLLLTHAAGYLLLLQDDGSRSLQQVLRHLLGLALLVAGLSVSAVLAGVAVLMSLGAAAAAPPAWALWLVPLVPAVAGLLAWLALRRRGPLPVWLAVRQQWLADQALLRRWEP